MNLLELVQRLWLEVGASGSEPDSAEGQTGENKRLVTWTNAAWKSIQNTHKDWDWLRTTASFTTVAGQAVYPLGSGGGTVGVTAANHGMWARDTARQYLTSAGVNSEMEVPFIGYETWRSRYQLGSTRNTNVMPVEFSISPAKAICLPPSLAGYTFGIDYFSAPTDLEKDKDEPAMPAQYHEAIVYRAMMSYAGYDAASEVYQRGETEFKKFMRMLEADRRPEPTWGGALA